MSDPTAFVLVVLLLLICFIGSVQRWNDDEGREGYRDSQTPRSLTKTFLNIQIRRSATKTLIRKDEDASDRQAAPVNLDANQVEERSRDGGSGGAPIPDCYKGGFSTSDTSPGIQSNGPSIPDSGWGNA